MILASLTKNPIVSNEMNEYEFKTMLKEKDNEVRNKISKDIGADLELENESEIFVN